MRLEEIVGRESDRLPYFVKDEAGEPVSVHFAPLLESDRDELLRPPWSNASYGAAWQALAGEARTRKLVFADATGGEILGLLRLGYRPSGTNLLVESLLEASPAHRARGVGSVLIARLVAESYNEGAFGQLRVEPHVKAVGFYLRLGFAKTRFMTKLDFLKALAEALFESVTK